MYDYTSHRFNYLLPDQIEGIIESALQHILSRSFGEFTGAREDRNPEDCFVEIDNLALDLYGEQPQRDAAVYNIPVQIDDEDDDVVVCSLFGYGLNAEKFKIALGEVHRDEETVEYRVVTFFVDAYVQNGKRPTTGEMLVGLRIDRLDAEGVNGALLKFSSRLDALREKHASSPRA